MPTFHFSLGPVQEFVNQARRTSDFWAGSFLLSWLSGVAMCAVRAQGGEIIFPHPPAAYLDWISGRQQPHANDAMARVGAIPNRFSAHLAPNLADEKQFDGAAVVQAVRDSWTALAVHTLQRDRILMDAASLAVWQRQIVENSLWEMQWLITPGEEDRQFNALDQRKRWRSHIPKAEPGAKCTLMHGWQELSGAPYADIDHFWRRLRESSKGIDDTLGENEKLCAHAWVKRRFEQYFDSFRHRLQNDRPGQPGLQVYGWQLKAGVPSTHYLAALPWLEQLLRQEQDDAPLHELVQQARRCQIQDKERNTSLLRLQQASAGRPAASALLALDAIAFFADEIENSTELPADVARADLQAALGKLSARHGAPGKFYALLLMDGDSLGKHIESHAQELARALQAFTGAAPEIVRQRSGFLVYAGGDDVLALLPLDEALLCATQLRQLYLRCFAEHASAITQPSISAAIEFAHCKTPLTQMINDAHDLLDNIAKQRHGRDSIAVRVWKGSGQHLGWGMPWQLALQKQVQDSMQDGMQDSMREGMQNNTAQLEICALAADLEKNPALYSGGFFQRAQLCYDKLAKLHDHVHDSALIEEMLIYEYGHSLQSEQHAASKPAIRELIAPLLRQSQQWRRRLRDGQKPEFAQDGTPCADAALLICFLLQEKPAVASLTTSLTASLTAPHHARAEVTA